MTVPLLRNLKVVILTNFFIITVNNYSKFQNNSYLWYIILQITGLILVYFNGVSWPPFIIFSHYVTFGDVREGFAAARGSICFHTSSFVTLCHDYNKEDVMFLPFFVELYDELNKEHMFYTWTKGNKKTQTQKNNCRWKFLWVLPGPQQLRTK